MDTTKTTSETSARHTRYARGLAIADRRRGYSYVERASHVGGAVYAVPSCTVEGKRYRVDAERGTCECADYHRGHTCKHVYCAMILYARRRRAGHGAS